MKKARRLLALNLALVLLLALLPFGAMAAELREGVPAGYTKVAGGEHEVMTFTPEETAVYTVSITDGQGRNVNYITFYSTSTNLRLISERDDGMDSGALRFAGETYRFYLKETHGSDISRSFEGDYVFQVNRLDVPKLALAENQHVNSTWAAFTAEEDGYYRFETNGAFDLYQAEAAVKLNPNRTAELFAGDTCYIYMRSGDAITVSKEAEPDSDNPPPFEVEGDTYPGTRVGAAVMLFEMANGSGDSGGDRTATDFHGLSFTDLDGLTQHEVDAIAWACENRVMSGRTPSTFEPQTGVTRAQAITFLYRVAGEPAPKTDSMPFTDVPQDAYYYQPVLWALGNDLLVAPYNCESETVFGPNQSIQTFTVIDSARLQVAFSTVACKEHTWDAGKAHAPGCTTCGSVTYTCTVCGTIRREKTQEPLGHDWSEWETITAATCEASGLERRVCANVSGHVEQREVEPLGHDWSEWSVLRPATETTDGVNVRVCLHDSSHVEYQTIPKHTHETEITNAVEPTCTEKGYSGDEVCKICGETVNAGEEIPALGHTWGEWTVTKEATTSEEGEQTRTCSVCGEKETQPIEKLKIENPFTDVAEGKYYYNAVLWAVNHDPQITAGTGDGTTFSPDKSCTRAEAVTFLWRAMGKPEPKTTANPFKDVSATRYYYKAVLWAVENGITAGTGDGTTFSPDMTVDRAQTVSFLWRLAGKPAAEGKVSFTDVTEGWYYNAVLWAAAENITAGTGDGTTFSPGMNCSRGQIVTLLHRGLDVIEAAAK